MSDSNGNVPNPEHFETKVTRDKVTRYLDAAQQLGIEVIGSPVFIGSRDFIIYTRGMPIPGPAGRRIFSTEERHRGDRDPADTS